MSFPTWTWMHHLICQVNGVIIPTWLERGTKRQQAEVKSLDHVFIPAEEYLNDKDIVNKD